MTLENAINAINDAMHDVTDEMQLLAATKVKSLMHGYDRKWKYAEWATISLEDTVHLPIVNPATGRSSRTYTQAGKHDGIIDGYGKRLLLEHKTTSDDIEDPNSTYWRRLDIDAQVSQYMLQKWQGGDKLDGTLYDVIRKPGIRPKKIANRDRQAILATGEYFGIKVSELTMRSFSVGNDRENNELYFNRLRREVLDNPAKYFQRKPIYRMDHEVVEYASELWNIAKTIGEASREDTHYRNSEACMTWGSPCEYLGVCSGHDTIDSDKWESIETVHSELDGEFPDGGRTVLTCSRMKTFQTCRRKHQYRYILGKRRRDDEGREALFLGTIMHLALEAWWGQFTEEASNGDSSNGSPAIEVGQPRESEIS